MWTLLLLLILFLSFPETTDCVARTDSIPATVSGDRGLDPPPRDIGDDRGGC
jgi:hypothetical protein